MLKIMSVFGTRPEAIKLAPVIKEIQKYRDTLKNVIVVTAQHRQMLDGVLKVFDIVPDYDMDIMRESQGLSEITCAVLKNIEPIYEKENPDMILVQGDTTTVLSASLAAFYKQIPVGHVEAGLRSYKKYQPFPEEINRHLTSVIADIHFAPTNDARTNLIKEGINENVICVTGNTVVDALLDIASKEYKFENDLLNNINGRMILITAHRRESFGQQFVNVCNAILSLAERYPEITFVYPVHLNPNVKDVVYPILGNIQNILLIEPVEYLPFVHLMKKAYMLLTDSGGIQEEAPSLNKPVLILRSVTERPEVVKAGCAKLVGTNTEMIISETVRLLEDSSYYNCMTHIPNPFGDGNAAQRIVSFIINKFVMNKQ